MKQYLCSDAPAEPPYVSRVSTQTIKSTGDEHMISFSSISDVMVEVCPCIPHGTLPKHFTKHNHRQPYQAHYVRLWQNWKQLSVKPYLK